MNILNSLQVVLNPYLPFMACREVILIAHGYGKSSFVASNDTPEGRAENHRVELLPLE